MVFHSYCGWVFHILKKIINRKEKPFKTATSFHGVEELFFRAMAEEGEHSLKPLSARFKIFYSFLLVRLIRFSCINSDKVFCLNLTEKTFLAQAGYQKPDRIGVLPNDVDDIFFQPRVYKTKAESLLFVGQWLPMKGVTYLVEAFARLARDYPRLKIVLAGTLKSSSKVLADFPAHLRARVEVFPEVVHEEMLEHFRHADIFILPSLFEAFNRAIVEAMATGLPAISTPVGIVADVFEDKTSYLKIPFRNTEAIVEAVSFLINDPARREAVGRAAQQTVSMFRQSKALEICFDRYESLMKEPFSV